MFEKNTIMGQVLFQVKQDKNNIKVMDEIEDLIDRINEEEYLENDMLVDTDIIIITDTTLNKESDCLVIETEFAYEISWLIFELVDIYKPRKKTEYRLYNTLYYLIGIYIEKYNDIEIILKMITIISTVWLHPDHLGEDKFIVHPITLPNFGKEF
jgi:hypothetical protein